MSEVKTENPLGYEKVSSLLRKFAVPSVVAMVVSSLYNLVDQIFIGQCVGYLGNAATNVAFPLTTICMAITLALGIGTATRFSIYLGRKENDEAAKVVGTSTCMMIFAGIVYVAAVEIFLEPLLRSFGATGEVFPYAVEYSRITTIGMPFLILMNGMSNVARADGSPTYSMTTMVIGAVVNTALDALFVMVFEWGVAGAAWATVIGQAVSLAFAVRYLWKIKRVTLKKEYFRLDFKDSLITLKTGMSHGLTQLAITLVQVVMNKSMVHYGVLTEFGADIPLAAAGVVMKVNAIVLSVIIGINQGLQPIIGFNYGAKRYDRVKQTYILAVKIGVCIGVLALLCFEFLPEHILSVFGKEDATYTKFAVHFMRIFLMMIPLGFIQMTSSNFFSAIGKAVKGSVLALTRQVIFFIPSVLILPLFFGLDGILYAGPVSDVSAFLVCVIFVAWELKRMENAAETL